jgi:hypothetical protein
MDQKHPGGLCLRDHISPAQARFPANPEPYRKKVAQAFQQYQECRNPTSEARSNMRANTDKKQGKTTEDLTRFSPGQPPSRARVFPTRCKLTHEPRCVGKMTTPATTCNSRNGLVKPNRVNQRFGTLNPNTLGCDLAWGLPKSQIE